MALPPEVDARAMLAEMKNRIAQGPAAALGVPADASGEELRAAFMQLTKRFHPIKFSRFSPEIARDANEVFLALRSTYEAAARGAGYAPRGASPLAGTRGTGAVRAIPTTPAAPGRAPPQDTMRPRPSSKVPVIAAAQGAAARPGTASKAPATSAPPAGSAFTTSAPPARSTAVVRAQTASVAVPTGAAAARARTGSVVPTRQTPASGSAPVRTRTASVAPTPSGGRARRPTLRDAIAEAPRPPDPIPVAPPTRAEPPPPNEELVFADALNQLRHRNWTQARITLHALAVKMPTDKRFRAYLAYARGREAQDAGRLDEARSEFARALSMDPGLSAAQQGLDQIPVEEPKKAGGFFSRLLKK
jgi:hypothetical protein